MKINKMKRSTFIILLVSLIALCTVPFIDTEKCFPTVESTSKLSEVKSKVEKENAVFDSRRTVLQKQSDSLTLKFEKHKKQLAISKMRSTQTQNKVLQSITELESTVDTASTLERCDSLKNQTIALIQEIQKRDSLCDETMSDLVSLLEKKDSIVSLFKANREDLKSSLDSALENEKILEQELLLTQKSVGRKKLLNKFLSAGLLILSGITATLFIIQK